jgi:hypothetical protein
MPLNMTSSVDGSTTNDLEISRVSYPHASLLLYLVASQMIAPQNAASIVAVHPFTGGCMVPEVCRMRG